jgi:hypothetical protein
MGSVYSVLLVVALGGVGSGHVVAQDARLRSDVDTTLVTVGDRIRLTVSIEHSAGARIQWPDSLDVSPFEVLAAEALPPSGEGDRVRSGVVLTLAAFELGALEIPSFDVTVLGPGEQSETVSTDRFGVEVVTVGADESGDIRDIRGPLALPVSVIQVSLLFLALLLGLAVALWLLKRRRRRGIEPAPVPDLPLRPAHEVALEALARVEASPLLERGQVKEYHIEVSEILRTYVEGRFSVPALEMTTREVAEGLRAASVDADIQEGLRRFLDRCDLVKFAKVRPDADRSRSVLELGRELVRGTAVDPGRAEAPREVDDSQSDDLAATGHDAGDAEGSG